jgi:DNA-binding NarL/FixJ family response regulator
MKASPEPKAIQKKRILIVDDHPITREGLANLIRQTGDLSVCGEAADAAQAISILLSSKPDLVLADISLPGRSGIDLIKDVHASNPKLPVMVLTMHDEALYAERALRAGARGYMMKQVSGDRLLHGIREVLSGKICVSSAASGDIMKKLLSRNIHGTHGPNLKLSDREFEVFRLLGEGYSTGQIGERLSLSPKTVESHRKNIKAKLEIKTSSQLVSFAARWSSIDSSVGPDAG